MTSRIAHVLITTALIASTATLALNSMAGQSAGTGAATSAEVSYSLETKVGALLDNPKTRAVIKEYAPAVLEADHNPAGRGMTLKEMQPYSSDLTDDTLTKIGAALAKIDSKK